MIRTYIAAHTARSTTGQIKELPLVFFSDADLERAKRILGDGVEIETERNVRIKCRHFPYTCKETPQEHSRSSYCSCRGADQCQTGTPLWRSYIDLRDNNSEYFSGRDNCYNDCCCVWEAPVRHLVWPKGKPKGLKERATGSSYKLITTSAGDLLF